MRGRRTLCIVGCEQWRERRKASNTRLSIYIGSWLLVSCYLFFLSESEGY